MKLKILFAITVMPIAGLAAQSMFSNSGASVEAIGGVTSVYQSAWALLANPAGIAGQASPLVAATVRRLASVNLSARSIVLLYPTRAGCWAAGVGAFGDHLYDEQALSAGWAHKLGITSIGIRTDVMQLRIDAHGVQRAIGVSTGAQVQLSPRLAMGIYARNVNLPSWSEGQSLPILMSAGLLYKPSISFATVLELEKAVSYHPTIKGGFEYGFRNRFFARTGFNLFPQGAFGGVGFRMWKMAFDYATHTNQLTGMWHQVSVSVQSETWRK